MKQKLSLIFALYLFVFFTLVAAAQTAPTEKPAAPAAAAPAPVGEIAGTVKAGTMPLPYVSISAVNTLTGKKVFTTTDLHGQYKLAIPSNGRYVVRAELPAFAAATKEAVVNATTPKHQIDLEMMLYSRAQAAAAQQQEQLQQQVSSLASRGFQNLGLTQGEGAGAGVGNAGGGGNGDSFGSALPAAAMNGEAATESVSVTGNMGRTESFGLDSEAMQDRIQEFRDRAARGEFGGIGGIQIGGGGGGGIQIGGGGGGPGMIMIGGPGGGIGGVGGRGARFNINQPHGALTYNVGASALDARPYAISGQTANKPDYAQHRISATIGGPLNIPHVYKGGTSTFYFINYFASVASNPFDNFYTVPTVAERAGDFSATTVRSGANAGLPIVIYDPLTNLPFPGNVIPAGRTNLAAAGLLRFLPTSNQAGAIQNFHRVTSADSIAHNFNMRLNHSFGAANTSQNSGRRGGGGGGAGGRGGGGGGAGPFGAARSSINFGLNFRTSNNNLQNFSPNLGGTTHAKGWNVSLGYVRGIKKLTTRTNFSFNRNNIETRNLYAGIENVAGTLGINGVSTDPFDFGSPSLAFTNYSGIRDISPLRRIDDTYQFSESASINIKKHNMRFGGDLRLNTINLHSNPNPRGSFTFTGFSTAQTQVVGPATIRVPGTGYDFADFLLGLPQQTTLQFGANTYKFRGNSWDLFFQDDWRMNAKLTINMGLRYEYVSPFTEANNRLVNLDAAPNFTAVAAVTPGQTGLYTGAFPSSLVNPDRNNFAPRIGIAWTPFKKTVVRGGYGINYNTGAYASFVQQLAFQPPFSATQTNITAPGNTLTLQNGFPAPTTALTNNFGVDRNYRLGYAQTWNLDVQRELHTGLMLNVSYVGTKGSKLDLLRAPNRGPNGLRIAGVQAFTWESSDASSILNSGTVRLRKRMQKGMAVGGSYTFSKSIDNASSIGGGGSVVAQDDQNLAAERGLSSFDQRHRFNADYTIELPFGTNKRYLNNGGIAEKMFGDWTISGSVNANSGNYFTARVLGNFGDIASGTSGTLRANVTGQSISGPQTILQFFNTSAFAAPPAGQFGNAGRNTIQGPGSVSLDLSANKSIPIKDSRAFNFRLQVSNLLNHANYSGIDTAVNSPSFGRVTSVGGMRRISLNTMFRF